MTSACGGRLLRVDLLELGEQLGANPFGDRHAVAGVANSVFEDLGVRFLAVLDHFAVEIDLEATLARGRERHANLTVNPTGDLGCHTGSLEQIASRNAVLDLQLYFAFSHATETS